MPTYKNLAAAWKKKTKNGDTYVSFKAEVDIKAGTSLSLFPNDKGDNPARPDFRAYEKIEDDQETQHTAESISSDIPF